MTITDPVWVPDACTLPTVEQPVRLAEFDGLFAAVRHVDPLTATHTRMRLTGLSGLAATVRDLTRREASCCSFFTFTITEEPATDGETVTLDIAVPGRHADVLNALTRRAITAGLSFADARTTPAVA